MPKYARSNSYDGRQSNQALTGSTRAANTVEAAAGDSTVLYISPSTLSSAVGDLVPSATAAVEGVVFLTEGTSSVAYPVATKFYADNLAIAGAPAWSESVSGIGQLSTNAEAIAGTNDTTAMTPLKVAAALVASLPITGGAGSFTTLAASGLASLSGSATITTGAAALNLASDASTGAVNVGTGAGARTITIGNVTGATAVAVNTGTGHFTVTTTGTGDIILNSDDTMLLDSDGVLELNSSAGVISIGNDADANNINIGTGAAARTITIGNSTGATSLVLNSGTGAINVGTNAIAHSITVGNDTGATALVLTVGTGNFVLDGVGASTYTIGASTTSGTIAVGGTAQTGTITIGSSSGTNIVAIGAGEGATTVNIAGGATNAKTVNIGTGAVANVLTLGSVSGAASMALKVGTGNFTLEGNVASTYTISGTGANTGTITIDGGTGARTINVANSTGIKTINIAGDSATSANIIKIGTGAAAQTVTIGSTNTTSATTINAGSGNVNVTGGHLAIASVAKTLLVNGGAVTDFIGTGTLTAGTQTIANTNIATGDVILLTRTGAAASTTLGELTYTISDATSFTVTSLILGTPGSTQTGDLSTYAYFIVRPT